MTLLQPKLRAKISVSFPAPSSLAGRRTRDKTRDFMKDNTLDA